MAKKNYKTLGNAIEVTLDKDFSVIAIYIPFRTLYTTDEIENEQEEEYLVQLWLKYNGIDDGLPINIQHFNSNPIIATKSTIKKKLVRIVNQMYEDEELDYYIDRYMYYSDCFEYGNNYYETNNKIEADEDFDID